MSAREGSKSRLSKRWRAALAALGISAVMVPLATPGGASLTPSKFEGADGNQIVNDTQTPRTDWVSFLPDGNNDNLFRFTDTASGATDNSLAGGTKDDTECATPTLGSIPQNKDDLLRFYVAHETIPVNNVPTTFLYLGYVRALPSSTTASAHGVFELQQSSTRCPDIPGKGKNPATPSPFFVRIDGDIRIAFDDEGGATPLISYQRWNQPNPNVPGAWSAKTTLNAQQAEGAFNAGTIDDHMVDADAAADESLTEQRFSEIKINMNAAGLLNPNSCVGFGAAGLFTGSSGNSDQEQSKDFVAPGTINLQFCAPATVTVNKTFSATPSSNAVFQLYYDADNSGTVTNGDTQIGTCTITPADVSNGAATCSLGSFSFGTSPFTTLGPHRLVAIESTVPNGFNGGGPQTVGPFTFGPTQQNFTVNFSNSPAPGDVDLKKVDDAGNPLSGAVFTLYTDNATKGTFDNNDTAVNPARTCTTNASGDCLETGVANTTHAFNDLPLGDYCVNETTVPPGHDAAAPQCFSIGLGSSAGTGQTVNLGSFTNPRKHRIVVLVCHEGTDTLFQSSVRLEGATDAQDVTKNSLAAGSLTAAQQKVLCDTGGASFGNLSGHDDRSLTVDMPTH